MTVLLVTETGDLAADLIVLELQRRGADYRRFNQDRFPDAIQIAIEPAQSARFWTPGWDLMETEVGSAWYRSPPRAVHADRYVDAEARTFLANLWAERGWSWINEPTAAAMAENKLWQLRAAARVGLDIPATLITNRLEQVQDAFGPGPVIVKTIAGAAVTLQSGAHHIFTQLLPISELGSAAVRAAPCIFQATVKPGADVRVTVIGNQVLAAEIVVDAPNDQIDWRAAPLERVSYRSSQIPGRVAAACIRFCEVAGIVYGAFDFIRQPEGRWVFLEVNPSGQWGWIEHATGLPITAAIVDALLEREVRR